MFYAPWCGHCKRLKPEFELAASKLLVNDPPVHLVKVDCTEAGKDTCGRFDVRGYPTLKIFRAGEVSQDYNGPREAQGIIKYMKGQVGPASKELKSEEELSTFFEKNDVTVVSYLEDEKDREVFQKVASALRETVAFGHYTGKSSQKSIVLRRPNHLHTKLEPSEVTYEGKVAKSDITDWINSNYHGLVGHRTVDNMKDFVEPVVIAFYSVDYVKNVKGTNYWRNRIMKVAKENDDFKFAVSNKDDFLQEAQEYGLSAVSADKPEIVIRSNGKKYVMSEEFSVDTFRDFLVKFNKGELEPYLKSEAIPEDNDSNAVKVAVAKNFDSLVQESKKDVLIEFYAPWCGHCKKLSPVYDELGQKLADEDVEIVKMDATANDVPSPFDVRGFPTLYWLPAKSKTPEPYNGGRELDDFIQFIAKKASSELKGWGRDGKVKKTEL